MDVDHMSMEPERLVQALIDNARSMIEMRFALDYGHYHARPPTRATSKDWSMKHGEIEVDQVDWFEWWTHLGKEVVRPRHNHLALGGYHSMWLYSHSLNSTRSY